MKRQGDKAKSKSGGQDSKALQTVSKADAPKSQGPVWIQKPDEAVLRCEITQDQCAATTGVRSHLIAGRLLNQTASLQKAYERGHQQPNDAVERGGTALDAIGEMKPASASEAMLAVQMIGVHDAVVEFLRRATIDGQTVEGVDANVLRATKLMRLFNDQLEAMAKLKGTTGQQKVTVEHVHVHEGGQAIVGAVTAAKGNQGSGG